MQRDWIIVGVFAVLGVISATQGFLNAVRPSGSQDFQWSIARYLLNHENPYQLYSDHLANRISRNPFVAAETPVYPASAEVFLWPLAALERDVAKWLWAAANELFAIGSVIIAARLAGLRGFAVLACAGLFLASTPVRTTIGNGQQGLFSFFFLLLAVLFQQQNKKSLAAICLAASWFKYTITFPLSLIFLRSGWRATLAPAIMIHVVLTVFLAFWINVSPLQLLLAPLMLAENAVSATMFDVMAISRYMGITSLVVPALIGITLFFVAAFMMFKSNNEPISDLCLLSLICLVWSYHWVYDYFVLIIPITFVLKHWQQGATTLVDVQIALCTFLIWFVQRVSDGVLIGLPGNVLAERAAQLIFWTTCFLMYSILAVYIFKTVRSSAE